MAFSAGGDLLLALPNPIGSDFLKRGLWIMLSLNLCIKHLLIITMSVFVYEYLHAMLSNKGKGFILQLESEVSASQHLLYLPGTEACEYPVELKCSKPPSCCGR